MARRFRPRKEFKFWLYHDLPEQAKLMEYIDYLRKTRQFAAVVRNGLRLMWTLGQGDLSVLFELFPGLRAQLHPAPDSGDMERRIEKIVEDAFKKARLEQGDFIPGPPLNYPALKSGGRGLQPLKGAKKIEMPVYDDEDTVVIRRDLKANTAGVFMDSVLGLQQPNQQ